MRALYSVALLSLLCECLYDVNAEFQGHSNNEDPKVKYSGTNTENLSAGDATKQSPFDNIGIVETLQYMISPEDFFSRYVMKRRPVAIRDVVRYWPAFNDWSDEYICNAYRDVDVQLSDDTHSEGRKMTIGEFMESYQKHRLEFSHEIPPKLHDGVILPTCLRCDGMYAQTMSSFLKIGSGGTSTSLHIDEEDVLLCAVKGNQTVTLVSPLYSNDVYGDDGEQLGVSPVNITNVNLEKYPRIKNVHRMIIQLNEGDTLFIPHLWWRHYLLQEGRHQMVSFTWSLNRNVIAGVEYSQYQIHGDGTLSFSDVLLRYEEWFHQVVNTVERPQCTGMEQRMSEYEFESASDVTHNEEDTKEEEMCYFDVHNSRSPCYFTKCVGHEDVDELACLKHALDYCFQWEDRGCVVELPQSMNRLHKHEFRWLQGKTPHH